MSVIAIVQLPPPVTGLASVNLRVVDAMREAGLLYSAVDVGTRGKRVGLSKIVARIFGTLKAAVALATSRSASVRAVYMPTDADKGLFFNILLAALVRVFGLELWVHHHNFSYIDRKSLLMSIFLSVAPRGTRHLALCDEMLARLSNQYSGPWGRRGHSGIVVNNAFMIDEPESGERTSDKFTLGHLSNLCADKGSDIFVALFIKLRQLGVDVSARVAGPIGDDAVQLAIEEAAKNFPDDFEWVGPVYGEQKSQFYSSIDAFVFPSRYVNEAQPLVLLEALAHGVPVLATDRGCCVCDHATSPGLIAPEGEFMSAAVEWISERSSLEHVDQDASSAKLKFLRTKARADLEFGEFILALKER